MQDTTPGTIAEPACRICEDWGSIVVVHGGGDKREYLCPQTFCEARDKRLQMQACPLPAPTGAVER